MARFCRDDEAAFDLLFERHSRSVYAFIARMVRDDALAEDLMQATFLSVVRSRMRYTQGTAVLPWLFTIAGNAARDALRRVRHADAHARAEAQHEPKSSEAPADPVLRKHLMAALDGLSAEQREAVVLHKVEGWSFSEIARAAGITETAARIRAHRGYEKLRQLLGSQVET
ncbi:MAG: RNA polymerase sigma factor [Archangiaceae bacterium]|nr:RNA polymerase sigma factor [Archangiaceae bacterium]